MAGPVERLNMIPIECEGFQFHGVVCAEDLRSPILYPMCCAVVFIDSLFNVLGARCCTYLFVKVILGL